METLGKGAVRVEVKLTNAIDEALVSRGLLAPHLLREYVAQALVYTGALTLVIPASVVSQLRLNGFAVNKLLDTLTGLKKLLESLNP